MLQLYKKTNPTKMKWKH